MRAEVPKTLIDNFTRYAIECITKVQARLHRIVLFCDESPKEAIYDFFKRKFPNAGINPDYIPHERMHGYMKQLVVITELSKINVFIHRTEAFLPAFRMEVTPKEKTTASELRSHLAELNILIPNLKPSSIEYTIDLFCKQPREVENLFMMIRRSLYVPYKNNPILYDNYIEATSGIARMNATFKIGDTKIYERGDDNKRSKTGWNYIDLNRVRLEHTANRKKLKRLGIITLSDLVQDCKFQLINNDMYKFKKFKSKRLPKYWDWLSYSTKNEQGFKGAFQHEYVLLRRFYDNIRQYMDDIKEYDFLVNSLRSAMMKFDTEWKFKHN